MTKEVFFLLFFTILIYKVKSQNKAVEIAENKTECYSIEWGFENFDKFSLCNGALNNHINLFELTEFPCENCKYKFNLKVDGVDINLIKDEDKYYFNLGKYLNEYEKIFMHGGDIIIVTIIIKKTCSDISGKRISTTTAQDQVLQVVTEGSIYSTFRYLDHRYPPDYNPCKDSEKNGLKKAFSTCMKNEYKKISMLTNHRIYYQNEHPGYVTLWTDVAVKTPLKNSINFSNSIEIPYFSGKVSISPSSGCETVCKGRNDGRCEYPAIATTYAHWIEEVWIMHCDKIEGLYDEYHWFYPMNHCLVSNNCIKE